MEWFLKVVRDNYANFNGRARRKEYWMFYLFYIIFLIVAAVLDNILGTTFEFDGINIGYGYLYLLFALAMIIPSLAVTVRRLHDVGKSGWMFLVALIPLIGGIWLLILMVRDSEPGTNEYGPNPKELGGEISDHLVV